MLKLEIWMSFFYLSATPWYKQSFSAPSNSTQRGWQQKNLGRRVGKPNQPNGLKLTLGFATCLASIASVTHVVISFRMCTAGMIHDPAVPKGKDSGSKDAQNTL